MGMFSYICKGCMTPINADIMVGGEKCVLIHVRHGKEIGRTEGHYNGYGGVVEDETYRNDGKGPNSHREVCKSEQELRDSYQACANCKIYKGKMVGIHEFCTLHIKGLLAKHKYCIDNFEYKHCLSGEFIHAYKAQYNIYRGLVRDKNRLSAEAMARELVNAVTRGLLNSESFKCCVKQEYIRLPRVKMAVYSGTVAYHSVCYRNASDEVKKRLIPSMDDPNQGLGKVRKKYE